MKKELAFGVVLLFFIALVFSSSLGTSTSEIPSCREGVCVKTQIIEPLRFNEPATVTIMVTIEKDTPNLGISLYSGSADIVLDASEYADSADRLVDAKSFSKEDRAEWTVNAAATLPITVSGIIQFPLRGGTFDVVGSAHTPSLTVSDVVRVYLPAEVQTPTSRIVMTPIRVVPLPSVTYGLPPTSVPKPIPTKIPLPPPKPYP